MEVATINTIARTLEPIGYSESTGMKVYDSYLAPSGFNHFIGIRKAGDLLIIEKVAEGMTRTYLSGILIYSVADNVLLKEIAVPQNKDYSRSLVVNLVKDNLLDLLIDATAREGISLEKDGAEAYIAEVLDVCYFKKSRMAALGWAENAGLLNSENGQLTSN